MKVTGGFLRSRRIVSSKTLDLRPTSNKVKQALFNTLLHRYTESKNFEKFRVLEPFGGTGAISIEAISRGAFKAKIIEKDKKNFLACLKNINLLNLTDRIDLINADFFKINLCNSKFNFFYVDPPYNSNLINRTLEKILDEKAFDKKNIFVCESEKNHLFKDNYKKYFKSQKTYGKSNLSFFILSSSTK